MALSIEDDGLVAGFVARLHHRPHHRHFFGRHQIQRLPADQRRQRQLQQFAQGRIGIGDDAVPMEDDALHRCLHELGHALFRVPHGLLGLAVAGDVIDQHKGRLHLSVVRREMRDEVDLHPAHLPVRALDATLVVDAHMLVQHPAHLGLDFAGGVLADHLAHREAQDVVVIQAKGSRVLVVGKEAGKVVRVKDGNEHRHVVGEQAELRGLVLRRQRRTDTA